MGGQHSRMQYLYSRDLDDLVLDGRNQDDRDGKGQGRADKGTDSKPRGKRCKVVQAEGCKACDKRDLLGAKPAGKYPRGKGKSP